MTRPRAAAELHVMRHDNRVRGDSKLLRLAGVLLAIFSAAGCCSPMSCKPAVVGMERYDALVHALADFRADRGKYPDTLEQLVPAYLPALPQGDADQGPSDPEYGASADGYVLEFRYSGPGLNTCFFDRGAGEWQCVGAY